MTGRQGFEGHFAMATANNLHIVSDDVSRRRFLTRAAALGVLAATRARAGDRPAPQYGESFCDSVQLPCGRRLAYADVGDPAARDVVVYHHGVPSCRLEVMWYCNAVRARPGTRMIALDRPGFGQSDPNPNGTFLSWPDDVKMVVDALRIDRFGVAGASGGGPYSLAVARAMPERARGVGLACPMAPLEGADTKGSAGARGARLALRHPVLGRAALARMATAFRRHPDRMPPLLAFPLSAPDRAFLSDQQQRAYVIRSTAGAFDQGPAEIAFAAAQLACPWGHWLKDVKTRVKIYQGCEDNIVTPAMAQYLVTALPNAEGYFLRGEGHLSVASRFASQIIAAALGM
jgi:pimeloyl-ACP methyl ester carboxylesterase